MQQHPDEHATPSYNPVTGELLGTSPLHEASEVRTMVERARRAQIDWGNRSVKERADYLLAIRDHLLDHADDLAVTIARDNGKSRLDAMATEVVPSAMALSFYCKMAPRFLRDRRLPTGNIILAFKRSKVARVPFGVVGIISPWNYPFTIAFSEVIMGLLAGNTVILKTASETQMVGLALKRAIEAARLPQGVFTYLNLPGRLAGEALLEAGIDKLFFTGSVPVGKTIMAKAAETLTPVNLELGGNDPMIVCDDADLARAAAGAVWAGFQNAGQTCGGVQRIYVHEAVYSSFLELLKTKTENLRVGYDQDFAVEMSAMTTAKQAGTVQEQLAASIALGARVWARSSVPSDPNLKNFLPATVLCDVTQDMPIMRDEVFGPVIGVMKVAGIDEAVEYANDSTLGLTASVWSRDPKRGEAIGRRLRAGVVTLNDHVMSHGLPETSWGGFKESGIGRTHGELGFNEMTQPQMIVHDLLPGVRKDLWWFPFDKNVYKGLKGSMQLLYGRSWRERLAGLFHFLRIVPRMFID